MVKAMNKEHQPSKIADRISRYTQLDELTGCHVWSGCKNPKGYGRIHTPDGRLVGAHRVAYELAKGPIPQGFHIDHLCNNTSCINPDHLEAVTPQENNRRSNSPSAVNARATHCRKGHEFTPENTGRGGRGQRRCRTCNAPKPPRERKTIKRVLKGIPLGEQRAHSKLTVAAVSNIKFGPDKGVDLAARYGVSKGTISKIRRGVAWKWVNPTVEPESPLLRPSKGG